MTAIQILASFIEFIGALIVAWSVVRGFWAVKKSGMQRQARLMVAEGAITGLSFKLAATFLKTLELRSWHQIAMFAVILALRIIIKMDFEWQISRGNCRNGLMRRHGILG